MITFNTQDNLIVGPRGSIIVPDSDNVTRKLFMLIEGECSGIGPKEAASKYGFCRQHYFQIRNNYLKDGIEGLSGQRRGPKTNYRRTQELVCQTIRHRFLDPDASAEVIAQKLRQSGFAISKRSVDRIFAEYGLQKKTLHISTGSTR